jgi:hypothetical protein
MENYIILLVFNRSDANTEDDSLLQYSIYRIISLKYTDVSDVRTVSSTYVIIQNKYTKLLHNKCICLFVE